ncbi:hypothetical protein C6361_16540 [Plantactinospora sp. BC1]|nr:hypothetical protein C6361_16540 [Plantactinospora sp. BC1]
MWLFLGRRWTGGDGTSEATAAGTRTASRYAVRVSGDTFGAYGIGTCSMASGQVHRNPQRQ